MKIRYKVTLWITAAGVLASIALSMIVFVKMRDLYYKATDTELRTIAEIVSRIAILPNSRVSSVSPDKLFPDIRRYWIKVYDVHFKLVYQSQLATNFGFPWKDKTKEAFTVEVPVPWERTDVDQDGDRSLTLRAREFKFDIQDSPFTIRIGQPMEKLDKEILELKSIIGIGLFCGTIVLVFLSYIVAGRILKPVSTINQLVRDISESALDSRIPLGESRDELYVLSKSLNYMFDRLQYSFVRQRRLIADASHELKSPITVLTLFLEDSIIRRDLPDAFRNGLIHHADILRRLSRLVKSLLDLSYLEARDKLDAKEFCLRDVMNSVLEDFKDVFAAKRIRVSLYSSDKVLILGDKEKLHRLLINIIDNAIKYNNEMEGSVEVSLADDGENIKITILNTGGGIPPEDLPHIFEPFYRVEKSRSPSYGGSGLGLALVKRIVEMHKGSIRIESSPGAWTRVLVCLPKTT
jgi:two-component system OmpR family sensor kinase